MRVLSNESLISRRHTINEEFTHEFQENAEHRQLSSLNLHQKDANFCRFLQFLSSFHQSIFEINQISNSNDQKES